MKKIILALLFLCIAVTSYAAEKNLYEMFKDTPKIKIYLKGVTSEAEDLYVKVKEFKNIFRDVLAKRINIEFALARNAKEADIIVTSRIKKYAFKEKVLPSFFSIPALVADTAAPKSAGILTVDYKLLSPKDGTLLLEFKDFTTVERRPIRDMIAEKAFTHTARKNINRFIYRAFYKQRSK